MPIAGPNLHFANPTHEAMQTRIMATVEPFIEHFHDIPVYVILCLSGRSDGQPAVIQSALWGSIAPAAWSFMLAARARGLGTVWTCLHLFFEEEAAQVLGMYHLKNSRLKVHALMGCHNEGKWT